MNHPFVDHYEVLQLSPTASADTVERVYRLLAKRFHPDNAETGDVDKFTAVRQAYEVLSDPTLRAEYDVKYDDNRSTMWKIFDQSSAHDAHSRMVAGLRRGGGPLVALGPVVDASGAGRSLRAARQALPRTGLGLPGEDHDVDDAVAPLMEDAVLPLLAAVKDPAVQHVALLHAVQRVVHAGQDRVDVRVPVVLDQIALLALDQAVVLAVPRADSCGRSSDPPRGGTSS